MEEDAAQVGDPVNAGGLLFPRRHPQREREKNSPPHGTAFPCQVLLERPVHNVFHFQNNSQQSKRQTEDSDDAGDCENVHNASYILRSAGFDTGGTAPTYSTSGDYFVAIRWAAS